MEFHRIALLGSDRQYEVTRKKMLWFFLGIVPVAVAYVLATRMWKIDEHLVTMLALALLLPGILQLKMGSPRPGTLVVLCLFLSIPVLMGLSSMWSEGGAETLSYSVYSGMFLVLGLFLGLTRPPSQTAFGIGAGGLMVSTHIFYTAWTDPGRGISEDGVVGLFTNISDVSFLLGLSAVSMIAMAPAWTGAFRLLVTFFVAGLLLYALTLGYLTTGVALGVSAYGWLTIFVIARAKTIHRVRLGLLFTLLGVATAFLAWIFRTEIQLFLGKRPDFSGRVPVWDHYLAVIGERPLFGAGWGRTVGWEGRPDASPSQSMEFFPAHNGYLDFAVSLGWLGTSLLVALLATLLVIGIRCALRLRSPGVGMWIGTTVLYLSVHDLSGTWLPRTIGLFALGALAAVAIQCEQAKGQEEA